MKAQSVKVDDLILKTVGDPKRNPRQVEFLKANTRYVAYGGARGGGKSFAVRFKAILLAIIFAGISILIVRRTLQTLRENHTIILKNTFNKWPKQLSPGYNDDEKAFMFPNGSRLKLGYCDNENDMSQYQGPEYDVVFIDEATQIYEEWFRIFDACVRGVNKFPKRLYLTCNPGGVGHGYVNRLFVERKFKADENPDDYSFIQALVWDNEPLFENDIGYINSLKRYMAENKLKEPTEEAIWYAKNNSTYVGALKNLPEHLIEAWLYGRWDVFAGQYFGEFDKKSHTCAAFPIPSHWRKTRAIDYGLDMLAVIWVATDEYGNAFVYRELDRPNLVPSLAADAIKMATPPDEYIEATYAPPDLWKRGTDTGIPQAETFAINGVPLIKSSNDREKGWLNVKEWLKLVEKVTTKDGMEIIEKKPRMMIFKNCEVLIENIPQLQHDKNKVNDVATEPHDITHAPDALRYWCTQRQLVTEIEPEPEFNQWAHEEPKDDGINCAPTEDYLTGGY